VYGEVVKASVPVQVDGGAAGTCHHDVTGRVRMRNDAAALHVQSFVLLVLVQAVPPYHTCQSIDQSISQSTNQS